jgi:hypothetical protein
VRASGLRGCREDAAGSRRRRGHRHSLNWWAPPPPTPHPLRGTWREQEFKAYNFDALGLPPAGGALHPLLKVRARAGRGAPACVGRKQPCSCGPGTPAPGHRPHALQRNTQPPAAAPQVRTQYRKIFVSMGFEEMPTNNYVESSFWNFDALFQPQQVGGGGGGVGWGGGAGGGGLRCVDLGQLALQPQQVGPAASACDAAARPPTPHTPPPPPLPFKPKQHPARDAHDTFFLTRPATSDNFPEDYLARVKASGPNLRRASDAPRTRSEVEARRPALRPGARARGGLYMFCVCERARGKPPLSEPGDGIKIKIVDPAPATPGDG